MAPISGRTDFWWYVDAMFAVVGIPLWGVTVIFLLSGLSFEEGPPILQTRGQLVICDLVYGFLMVSLHVPFFNPWFLLPRQIYRQRLHPQERSEVPLRRNKSASGSFDTNIEWFHAFLDVTLTEHRLIVRMRSSWRGLCIINAPFDRIREVNISYSYGLLRRRKALLVFFKGESRPQYFALACDNPELWAEIFAAHGVVLGHEK